TYQQIVRNEFKRLSKKWATLTEAERLSWISGAPNFKRTNVFGSVKQLDGKALYQSLNMNLFLIGNTDRVLCPAPEPIKNPTLNTYQQKTNGNYFVKGYFPADRKYLCYVTPPLSPAI